MPVIIWITGSPGVGKTSVGRKLARSLGYGFVDIPAFVKQKRIYEKRFLDGSLMVDERRLARTLEAEVGDDIVISGHLVVKLPGRRNRCIVLRMNPLKLATRLKRRKYSLSKIAENVESEFLGVVYSEAVQVFGKQNVHQVNVTGRKLEETIKFCQMLVARKKTGDRVDWLTDMTCEELDKLLAYLARSRKLFV